MINVQDIDFLIIGATKSATTWLQRALQADPAIYMPNPEIHFFSRQYERGEDWYLSRFDCKSPARVIGEKSNSYLEEPAAPARIFKAVPHARLIVQLRNPVERAYSDYCMLYRRGEVGRRIEKYLDPEFASDQRFISNGHYSQQLERFLELFAKDQLLVLLYEDVSTAPERQVNQVREFLGLPRANIPVNLATRVKDKKDKLIPPALQPVLKPLKPLVKPLRKTAAYSVASSRLRRVIKYPVLTDSLRAKLILHFAPHTEALETMIGQDFSAWRSEQNHAA